MKIRFNHPYPFYHSSLINIAKAAVVFTVTVFLFEYIIQPFSVNFEELRFSFLAISLFHGLLVGIIFLAFSSLLRMTVPKLFSKQAWTVGKELGFLFSLLLLIGVGNFFLRELIYNNPDNFSLAYLTTEIFNTYIVGSLFVVVIVMINYIVLLRSSGKKSEKWTDLVQNFHLLETDGKEITIKASISKDTLCFKRNDFLFAKSDGNYVKFMILNEDGSVSKRITRNTLANVEEQFQQQANIIRIHRSFIVNLQNIQSVKGNAQGYKLTLTGTNTKVPVSRTYIPVFEESLKD